MKHSFNMSVACFGELVANSLDRGPKTGPIGPKTGPIGAL